MPRLSATSATMLWILAPSRARGACSPSAASSSAMTSMRWSNQLRLAGLQRPDELAPAAPPADARLVLRPRSRHLGEGPQLVFGPTQQHASAADRRRVDHPGKAAIEALLLKQEWVGLLRDHELATALFAAEFPSERR